MFAFWPSFGLLVFFLVIFLECRAIAGRVTLPLGSFMMVFCFGAIGAPLIALLLQQAEAFADASASISPTTWLLGPPIEELAKALPVIVLAFLTRESRRLSIADLTLIGFASGAGFGFVEANLNALANGALPGVEYLSAFGLQTNNGLVFFAGHAVTTALVGLAAGIGLRFLPPNIFYAWVPSAFVILWVSFDHGIYNWKVLNATDGVLPTAHFVLEFLHGATLKGQLATWLLPIGLVAAQFIEAYLCSRAVGVRRDLLLAREWRPWVANEWLVALMRARLGRAVFAQTLAYFRLRRAFYLAAFETRRDPKNPTLARHARSLEDRLKRERSILFDPAPGTWLLPAAVLKGYALQWTWRMRWVLLFAVLLLLLFMIDPTSLPEGLRQFVFGDVFTIVMITAGLAFAVWRIILFGRVPPPDPLAAEGTAFASHYTRQLLLACSLACGLFPSLAGLLGWKALLPGAAFIGGYLPGWIAQGGNLYALLGLGAIGGAVAPDPRPAGEAFRHEIAAGEERIRRLGSEIEGTAPVPLDSFLEAMAKLDAERDAQARRQLALDGCERQASEATFRDPAPVVQGIKDEFDRLAGELLEAAAKDLDAMTSLQQAYATAWSEIMQDLDTHDSVRRRLRTPLRQAWQAQNDIRWALRVVEGTDDVLLPMQLTLLSELREVATTAISSQLEIVAAGVERIRATAAEYGENDPFGFAGVDPVQDDATLPAELEASTPAAEEPKPFGLRTAHPASDKEPDVAQHDPQKSASADVPSRGQHYQQALDQLIDAARRDKRYLETIKHLERSDEVLRQPIESQKPSSETQAPQVEDPPPAAPSAEHQGELEDLIDAIKRDSGYADFAKGAPAPVKARKEAPKPDSNAERQEQEKAAFEHRPAPVTSATADAPAEPQAERAASLDVIDNEWAVAAAAYKQAPQQPEAPSVEAAGLVTAAVPQATSEPPQAAVPIPTPKSVEHTEAAVDAVAEPAPPAELAPAAPALVEASASSIAPVDSVQTEAPAAVVETAQTEVSAPEPEAPAAPAQAETTLQAEPVERAEVEAPTAAIDTVQTEIATPVPAAPVAEAPSAPMQAEATSHAEAAGRTATEARAAETTEIAAPAAALEAAKSAATLVEPDAPSSKATQDPEPQQAKPARPPATPVERAETSLAVEPHQPAPEDTKPADEPKSRTESRESFFARLFEAALRQSSVPDPTSVRRDAPQEEKKPDAGLSSTTPREHAQPISAAVEKHDAESQKASSDVSIPAEEWLADFAALSAGEPKAQPADTSLEKIEWPALGEGAREGMPADRASIPDDVAKAFVTLADDGAAKARSDSLRAADTNDVEGPVSATPAIDSIQHVESEAPRRDVTAEAPPIKAVPELTEAPPIRSDDAASPSSDDTSAKVSKTDGTDEFASKVDRLSHLLDKLERAMQAATPAPQEVPAPAKPDPSTAPEPVEPAPAASFQPAVEKPKAEQPPEGPATAVEKPAAAESTAISAAYPDAPQAPADQHAIPVETVSVEALATTPAKPEAPSEPAPKPDVPRAPAAEPAPATTPAEPEAPSEPRQNPDRLSYLLTKLFEAVNKDSAPRPIKPQLIDPKPEPSKSASPETIAPAQRVASEVLNLRGPHPIAEPRDEPTTVEPPPPQEQAGTKIEERPEPGAPPAQAQSAVVDQPAAPGDAMLPASAAVATDAPLVEPPSARPDVAPIPPEPIKPSVQPGTSAPATHFGSRKSSRSPTPSAPADVSPPAQVAVATDAPPVEPPSARPDVAPIAPEPIKPSVQPRTSAPATHFGSRKSSRSPAPSAPADVSPPAPAAVATDAPPVEPPPDAAPIAATPASEEPIQSRVPSRSPAQAAVDTPPVEPPSATPDAAPIAPSPASEEPIKPRVQSRSAAPATHFGSRKSSRFSTLVPSADGEANPSNQPSSPKRAREFVDAEKPATTPKRDWKLDNEAPGSRDADLAKRAEPSFRMKTGSGALATVDTTPAVSSAASTNTPAKYYGPRYSMGGDDEAARNAHAQQHAISLSDALSDYYTRVGTPQPAMYTTDRATLHRIIAAGKLDAPRRRGAPWSISGMSRRGEVAIRLKPGAEQYVEFVPSTEIFGQVPHYYPRGVGRGNYQTHVLAEHLEYFDVTARQWAPLRG